MGEGKARVKGESRGRLIRYKGKIDQILPLFFAWGVITDLPKESQTGLEGKNKAPTGIYQELFILAIVIKHIR